MVMNNPYLWRGKNHQLTTRPPWPEAKLLEFFRTLHVPKAAGSVGSKDLRIWMTEKFRHGDR